MRDFEDFRDAVLNKISALEVSDDEKWEKLCKVLIFCLVKSSYGPHVQNLELHLKHRSNGHLIYSPFDFANMGRMKNSNFMCLIETPLKGILQNYIPAKP